MFSKRALFNTESILWHWSCRPSMFTYLHVQNCIVKRYLVACSLRRHPREAAAARCWGLAGGTQLRDKPVCHACTRNEASNNSLEVVIKIFVVPMLFICICGEALWLADRRSRWCRWFARALYGCHCWRLWPIPVCEIITSRNYYFSYLENQKYFNVIFKYKSVLFCYCPYCA